MQGFKSKVAVITGAGRGIGRGIALHCAKEGMKIVLAGIGMESLTKTAADLHALGAETLIVQTDVSLLEDVENLAARSYAAFGAVDLLVNNAGVNVPVSVLNSKWDDWDWMMGVNFYGVLYGVKTFIPRMIQQDSTSHVVNVSSLAGIIPGGGRSGAPYNVSKHGVVLLSEALYFELAQTAPHIKVSVYIPGFVNTEIYASDRSRPKRFQTEATIPSKEEREAGRERVASGYSVAEGVRILFHGIQKDQLYIGAEAFHEQLPYVTRIVRDRAENILNDRNPEIRNA